MEPILEEILAEKREEIERRKSERPLEELKTRLADVPPARSFRDALRGEGISLIAEIKPRSPSSGRLTDLPAPEIARIYEQEKTAAVSVLTDRPFFGQGLETLRRLRGVLSKPILRKDFLIDPYQVYEAAEAGADAVLLIAAILEPGRLKELHECARERGLDVLVEVHSGRELHELGWTPPLLGINNRSLEGDFSTDLAVTEDLAPRVDETTVLVSESGIHTSEDLKRLSGLDRVDAVLVGTSLLEGATDVEQIRTRVRELMNDRAPSG